MERKTKKKPAIRVDDYIADNQIDDGRSEGESSEQLNDDDDDGRFSHGSGDSNDIVRPLAFVVQGEEAIGGQATLGQGEIGGQAAAGIVSEAVMELVDQPLPERSATIEFVGPDSQSDKWDHQQHFASQNGAGGRVSNGRYRF